MVTPEVAGYVQRGKRTDAARHLMAPNNTKDAKTDKKRTKTKLFDKVACDWLASESCEVARFERACCWSGYLKFTGS